MGKVQDRFFNGSPGAVSRSIDDIIISIRNASDGNVAFGSPVFLGDGGAVPFDINNPQEFSAFLGFAVRGADKTPDTYPQGQFNDPPEGVWHAGDVMEVLVRGSIAVPLSASGSVGGKLYIRKSDGRMTASAGASGTTVQLENVTIRNPRANGANCCEAVITERNLV